MKSTTPKKIESILRKYAVQLKRKEKPLSSNEVQTMARLTSSYYRLMRGGEPSEEIDVMNDGVPGFTESLSR